MGRIEKTVFISYRRTNAPWALAIYQDLTQHGYDVFFDYNSVPAGDFEAVILENVRTRAHFLVLLTPSALDRCSEPEDWLRREIETALDKKRNIVPLMFEGFSFGTPAIADQLTGKLALLRKYQALSVPIEYFAEAMDRLRTRYLNIALDAVPHSVSLPAAQAAKTQQAAAAAAPIVQEGELSAQTYFERGFSAADLDEKIRFYTEAIRLKPNYSSAYYNRGTARQAKGDAEGALGDYDEAIRLKLDYASAYYNRGIARRAKGDVEGALGDFDEAIRLKADYADAYINRGIVRKAKGDVEGALRDYNQAIHLKPDYADAYVNRGIARRAKGDVEGALGDYEEAIRLKPDLAEAYVNRGSVRKAKGDVEGALGDYEEAIRLKPDLAEAYYNRAVLKRNRSEHRDAIDDYQKYLDLGGGERDGDRAEVEKFIRDLKTKL